MNTLNTQVFASLINDSKRKKTLKLIFKKKKKSKLFSFKPARVSMFDTFAGPPYDLYTHLFSDVKRRSSRARLTVKPNLKD